MFIGKYYCNDGVQNLYAYTIHLSINLEILVENKNIFDIKITCNGVHIKKFISGARKQYDG